MKTAMVIIRSLFGLLFIFASAAYFLNLIPVPEMTGVPKQFNEGLGAVGYFMPMLKTVELLCGIAFLSGFFVPLATVVIAPIIVNIFMYHSVIDRTGLPVALFLVFANIFIAYYYRSAYAGLLKAS